MFDSFNGASNGRGGSGGSQTTWIFLVVAVVVAYMIMRNRRNTESPRTPEGIRVEPNVIVEPRTTLPEERIINTLQLLKNAGGLEGLIKGIKGA